MTHRYDDPPVIYIDMQGPFEPDCSGCGRSIAQGLAEYTRHVNADGVAGCTPWCPKCWKKYKPEDTDDRMEPTT